MEKIQDKNKIIINHIFLIYKPYVYPSRNHEVSKLISLKNHILETKILAEKIAWNDLHEKSKVFKSAKSGRLSTTCYVEVNFKSMNKSKD